MGCNLSKFTTYNVGRVVHNNETGATTAQLIQPPASCPDNVFSSKKAKIAVVQGIDPQLNYDQATNTPVILVPRAEYVEQVGSSGMGFGGTFLLFTLLASAVGLALYLILRKSTPTLATSSAGTGRSYGGPDYDRGYSRGPQGPAPQGGGTTIVNNNSGNDGLLTGVMIGSMMSNNRSERIIERDRTIIERDSDSSSNSSSDDDSSSSSSDSSYSSDSSSDSSFSSDSSSSDSSFSSDSGGGSFSSDS